MYTQEYDCSPFNRTTKVADYDFFISKWLQYYRLGRTEEFLAGAIPKYIGRDPKIFISFQARRPGKQQ